MMVRKFLTVLGSLVGSVACVADLQNDSAFIVSDEGGKDEAAVIIGSVDWVDVNALAAGTAARENARAVAYLSIPAAGSRCTGSLIAPDVLMTNQHCIRTPESARGVTARFRFESGVSDNTSYDCSEFLGNDAALDFALLRCAGRPGDVYGTVSLEARAARQNERVYVIHQNCDYYTDARCQPTKKYSAGVVQRTTNGSRSEIGHDADTLGGSSGSPLFSENGHTVIGLHHAGSGGNSAGRGTMNWAVPMSSIVPVLQARYPGLSLGARAPVAPVDDTPVSTDPYEPNNTRADATIITLPFASQNAAVTPGTEPTDVDAYVLPASAVSRTIELSFTHAQGDLDLFIINADGATIARSNGTSNTERVTGVFANGGYIVVSGYRGAGGGYALTVR